MARSTEPEARTTLQNFARIWRFGRKNGEHATNPLDTLADDAETALTGTQISAASAAIAEYRTRFNNLVTMASALAVPVLRDYAAVAAVNIAETDIQVLMTRLYDYFAANSFTIESREFTFGSPAAGGSNVGNGAMYRLTKSWKNYDIETGWPDGKTAECRKDGTDANTHRHDAVFYLSGSARLPDSVVMQGAGSGRIQESVKAISAEDSLFYLANPSFDTFESTNVPEGWKVADPSTGAYPQTDVSQNAAYYREHKSTPVNSSTGLPDPKSIRLDDNVMLVQRFSDNRNPSIDRWTPITLRMRVSRNSTSVDGTLQIALASIADDGSNVTVTATSATKSYTITSLHASNWVEVALDLDQNSWPENFNADNLGVMIKLTGRTTGTLLIDDILMAKLTNHDGSWVAIVGGTTPFQLDDEFTYTDSNNDDSTGFIQQFLVAAVGRDLPSTNSTPTIADPSDV